MKTKHAFFKAVISVALAFVTLALVPSTIHADQKISINTQEHEIEYPAQVNGTYFTQPTRHFVVYKDGSNGNKAVLRGLASETEFYEALKKIGAKPGNNLRPADVKSAKGKRVQGSKLDVYIKWKGHKAVPAKSVITASKTYTPDFRFGGNLGRAKTMNTGCVICFDSCPVGIVSDHAWPTGTVDTRHEVSFKGNQKVLPKDGTPVTVIVKLAK